jgi:hypothetical protein
MRLLDHPAVQHALRSVDSVLSNCPSITGDQARQIIVVEMTYDCEMELRYCSDFANANFNPATRTRNEQLRASDLQRTEGPMTIMGIRFYHVDHLRDGDTWRVRNALGVL